MWTDWLSVMERGGPVMWPLLALSVLAVTLVLERGWFFASINRGSHWSRATEAAKACRERNTPKARQVLEGQSGVYAPLLRDVLDEPASDAALAEAVESQRHRLERFMPTLSTIITAAPMLGILGTVLGIIDSFELLGQQTTGADPRQVGAGIAEALISTAAGLVVALLILLPYNVLRAQADRTLGRIEALVASVREGGGLS